MNRIVAESGGTKTDWKIEINGKTIKRSGKSLHPSRFSDQLLKEEKQFWSNYNLTNSELLFFGAGGLKENGNQKIKQFLHQIGFKNITVKSDLHAAGLASYGTKSGWVGILGTGSVVFFWNGITPTQITGGLGHLIGDEGSGFYFGKLVLEAFESKKLNSTQEEEIRNLEIIPNKIQKFETARLSKSLSSEFEYFHKKNIDLFCKKHLTEEIKTISIIGSYGFFHQEIIQKKILEYHVNICNFIQYPIDLIQKISSI